MLSSTPARTARHSDPVRISEVVARPGIYTNSKRLNLPNQSISIIDPVSDKYRKIEELNLRGNCVQLLGEICQFTMLRVLDLSNNKIVDQREILHLAALRNLEVLHVSGNPFLQSRLTTEVLAVLEQLNCELSIQPVFSEGKPVEEARLENILLENYTDLIFIQSLYRKTEIHIELISQYNMGECDDPDYRYLLKHKDAILELDQSTGQRFLQELRLDAYALKKTLNLPDLLAAYRNLIDKQTDKRQQLIGMLDKRAKYLADLLQKKRRALSALKRDESNITFSPKKVKDSESPDKTVKKTEERQAIRGESTTKKHIREPMSEENLESIYYKNLTKRNPVYHLLYSPLHSLKPKEKDLLIETLSAHLKERTIELYRKEELLRHTEESYRLKCEDLTQEINILTEQKCQLTRRLIEFETTMKDFHFDVKGKLRLERQVDRRQSQLVEAQASGELYKEMYEQVKEGVEHMAHTEQKEDTLAEASDRRRKAKYFKLLCHKFDRLRNLKKLRKVNADKEDRRAQLIAYDALRRNALISRIVKIKALERGAMRMELGFFTLLGYAQSKRKQHELQKKLAALRKAQALQVMRLNIAVLAIKRVKHTRASLHYSYAVRGKCLKVLKSGWVRYGPAAIMPVMVRMAQFHNRKLITKALMAWNTQHDEFKREKVELTQRIYQWKVRKYLNKPFARWAQQHRLEQSLLQEKQQELMLLQRAASLQSIARDFIGKSKVNAKKAKRARINLQRLFETTRKQHIQNHLQNKLKQYYLGCRRNRESCIRLFNGLKEQSKKFLGHATFKLASTLMVNRARTFFSFYPNIRQARIKMDNHLANMQNIRYTTLREQLEKHRKERQPMIEDMKNKEQHYTRMSSILREELQAKDEKLRLYDKKFENLNNERATQETRVEKMRQSYENNLAEMRVRQYEFMEIIDKLQSKFQIVSAEVDQMAIEEIKKSYRSRYPDSSLSSIETSKVEIRNRLNYPH